MARPSFCMATTIMLSLVILTSAYDYGHDQKPKEKENLVTSKSEKPLYKKPEYDQPKSEENENHIPKTNDENIEKPEAKEKLIPEEKSEYKKPETKYEQEPPKYGEEKQNLLPIIPNYEEKKYELPTTIGVQGLVYCKSGLKYSPLPGAVARITCVAVDQKTHKTTQFTVLSKPCDLKGYFYATIYSELTIKNCKAYLDSSPMESCKVPTNINNGIGGDLLASNYNILTHHMKLSTVGPFFYTSYDHPVYSKPVSSRTSY